MKTKNILLFFFPMATVIGLYGGLCCVGMGSDLFWDMSSAGPPQYGEREPVQRESARLCEGRPRGLWAADWDNDGLLDFISGYYDGRVMVNLNIGTAGAPRLQDGVWVEDAYGVLDAGTESMSVCFDWNEDGRKDLLASRFWGLYFHPNVQTGLSAPGEAENLTVQATSDHTVSLSWNNPSDNDFEGVIILRSESSIAWRPMDRMRYHVVPGTEAAPGVEIVYKGSADHSAAPWTDTGLTPGTDSNPDFPVETYFQKTRVF